MKSKTTHTQTGIDVRCGNLKSALVGLGKVVPTKGLTDALDCVKIEVQSKQAVQLTVTDCNFTLRLSVPAQADTQCEPFLMPLCQLREQVRNRPASETVTLRPGAKAPPVSSFPEGQTLRGSPIPLGDDAVTSLLRAFTCGSSDKTRYVLQGAYFDVSAKGKKAHRIVATDGRHLFSSNSMHLPNLKSSIILPDHKLWEWKALAGSRPWTLRVGKAETGKDKQPFRIDGPFWSVSSTLIDGNYPNYQQVIPAEREFTTHIMITDDNRAALEQVLPKLPGDKSNHRPVGIQVRDKQLYLLAREAADQPWQLHPLGRSKSDGPDTSVQFNRDYLRKMIDFDLQEIAIIDEMSPVRFQREGDLMIVMPLRPTGSKEIAAFPKSAPSAAAAPAAKTKRKPAAHHSVPLAKKMSARREAAPTEVDPIVAAEAQIAEARQALAGARKGLISANTALKSARRQQRETDKEVRGIRSLLGRLRKHDV